MWRRTYLLLVLVRLYFAFSPSYIHPDENFQGPEVIAGQIFSYPVHLTWEFTSANPIRSVFPLWPVYGLPMLLLRWVWTETGQESVVPTVTFYTLRGLMFVLSFVLEDWAIHELVQSPQRRREAIVLVASSYVTWTYQTHTFSNSVETLLVAWSLVLIQRIIDNKRSSVFSSGLLAFLIVFGVFNRITFPAFILIPGIRLLPHFLRKPFSLTSFLFFGLLTTILAICTDTAFYTLNGLTLHGVLHSPTITPLNNLLYNTQSSNLALHGLHPYYQHVLINLPLLLGPAIPLLLLTPSFHIKLPLLSAISGTIFLSILPHQEPRFLIPCIPLLLSSVRLPRSGTAYFRYWLPAWLLFNATLGILMGVYHQGGVIPTQLWLSTRDDVGTVLWWKTYSPPIWMLDGNGRVVNTTDLMGMQAEEMIDRLRRAAICETESNINTNSDIGSVGEQDGEGATYLVAPYSSTYLDSYTNKNITPSAERKDVDIDLHFDKVWTYTRHVNLDDLDFAEDGVWQTVKRVFGRRGLRVWRVTKTCV